MYVLTALCHKQDSEPYYTTPEHNQEKKEHINKVEKYVDVNLDGMLFVLV